MEKWVQMTSVLLRNVFLEIYESELFTRLSKDLSKKKILHQYHFSIYFQLISRLLRLGEGGMMQSAHGFASDSIVSQSLSTPLLS